MSDIFDEVALERSSKGDIFDQVWEEREKGGLKEISQEALIGATKGLGSYGNLLDFVGLQSKKTLTPGQQALYQAEAEAPESLLPFLQEEDIIPRFTRLASTPDVEEVLEEIGINPQAHTPAGKTAQRIGHGLTSSAAFLPTPLSLGAGALGGGIGGVTEELTGSPLAGDIAEIATNIGAFMRRGPTSIGQRAKKMKVLKELGFDSKEITLLSQGEGKLNFLGKLASKDKKMEKLFSKIYSTHGNLYDGLREASKDFGYLHGDKLRKMDDALVNAFHNLTPETQRMGFKMLNKFRSKPITFKGNMDFIHDLNMKYGMVKGGKKAILSLKKPVMEGMKDLNPQAGEIFSELQSSYGNFKKIAKQLKPNNLDDILDASELITMAKGLIEAKGGLIVKVLGLTGARKLAREFLINPELQGLTLRVAKAIQRNQLPLAEKLLRVINKRLTIETLSRNPQQLEPDTR